jgi:predicted transport protein
MPSTPREMRDAIIRNLPAKTGKSLEAWVALLKKSGPKDPKEARVWLKEKHGLGHGQAGMIAAELTGGPEFAVKSGDELVDGQYADKKAGLRPIYDKLAQAARKLGKDVRIEPCKGYVPFMRNKQFAVVRASTATRVDLGLALGGTAVKGKLQEGSVQGTSERITHRIAIGSPAEVDAEVLRWMKLAYEHNA